MPSGLGNIPQVLEGLLHRTVAADAQDEDAENGRQSWPHSPWKARRGERAPQGPPAPEEVDDVHGHDDHPTIRSGHREAGRCRGSPPCAVSAAAHSDRTSRLSPTVTKERRSGPPPGASAGHRWQGAVLFPHTSRSKMQEELGQVIGTSVASSYGSLPGGKTQGFRSEVP